MRTAIVEEAKSWIGTPYVWGAADKNKGADCATFGLTVFKNVGLIEQGVMLPREHKDWIYRRCTNPTAFRDFICLWFEPVEFDDRQPGDVVTFMLPGTVREGFTVKHGVMIESHVAVLVEKDVVVHADSAKGIVRSQRIMKVENLCAIYRHRSLIHE